MDPEHIPGKIMIGAKATEVCFRHVLNNTQALFRHRDTLSDASWKRTLESGKKVLKMCGENDRIRYRVGRSTEVWEEIKRCLLFALPPIERQSCVSPEAVDDGHSNSNAMLMLSSPHLKDNLERVTDIVRIARNLLAASTRVQNLAAEASVDQEILKYIDLCVRVTGRGYDGDESPDNATEKAFNTIVDSFKTLLVACLQFLHNLVMKNEHRKLLLWLDLFGNSRSSDPYFSAKFTRLDTATTETVPQHPLLAAPAEDDFGADGNPGPSHDDLSLETAKPYDSSGSGGMEAATLATHSILVKHSATKTEHKTEQATKTEKAIEDTIKKTGHLQNTGRPMKWNWASLQPSGVAGDGDVIQLSDTIIAKTADAAARTLREAKEQLLARLRDPSPLLQNGNVLHKQASDDQVTGVRGDISSLDPPQSGDSDFAADGSAEEDEEDDDEEEDGDEQDRAADTDRGLLTDIPLVLGPKDIEPLAMIIAGGIYPFHSPDRTVATTLPNNSWEPVLRVPSVPVNVTEITEKRHMQAVRCNILLAQDAGRNLLRELLIFIAAWELSEQELYFQLMIKIMDAILQAGLMPFAFQTFAEIKDIVSPAQCQVIKLLTQIFRKKYPSTNDTEVTRIQPTVAPVRVDLLIVRYVFTVFRQSIIPETCALIYLQGRIRFRVAQPEDFPLNLWDMERIYEGVYQFLEFFAVLTENEVWKELLIKWEIVSELVTLLRELDQSIQKAPLTAAQAHREASSSAARSSTTEAVQTATPLVERPYDPVPAEEGGPANYDPVSELDSPTTGLESVEPSEFEWKNLKKLVVLVLSSLVWQSSTVQAQIRQHGGIELVLACCNYDAYNPFIREHAIMCLKFLLEEDLENQEFVGGLEARKVLPSEVLDGKGYETYIDSEGKVGLRKRELKEGFTTVAHLEKEREEKDMKATKK